MCKVLWEFMKYLLSISVSAGILGAYRALSTVSEWVSLASIWLGLSGVNESERQ